MAPAPPRRLALFAYGVLCYGASMLSLVVLFGWLGGYGFVPVRLDEGGTFSLPAALAWNTAVMVGFGLFHSVFARSWMKTRTRRWHGRNLERVTYNLLSAIFAILLCLVWEPIPSRVWEVQGAAAVLAIQVTHALLWVLHMTSIVLMNHNDFFGLRQVGLAMRGEAYRPLPPVSEGYYLWTRLMLVVTLALIPWASPVMSVGRLQLCVFMTGYVVLGAWLSNRDRGDLATVPITAAAGPYWVGTGTQGSGQAGTSG
jgi:hypothetical protein